MSCILSAIIPVFALILIGAVLCRKNFPSHDFWPVSEQLTYYLLFPALLVHSLTTTPLTGAPVLKMAIGLISTLCAASLLMVLFRKALHPSRPAFTSIFQGGIRPNTFMGLSLAWALFGDTGLAYSAVVMSSMIPVVNLLCVLILTRHGEGNATGVGETFRQLVRNPLIIACAIGITLNIAGNPLPSQLMESLRILGRASLPMGLLAVGAGLRFDSVIADRRAILLSSLLKLLLLPLLAALSASLLGIEGTARGVMIVFTAIPVAISSFILARQLGGDHKLMAAIITVQTALSAVTLPLLLDFLSI